MENDYLFGGIVHVGPKIKRGVAGWGDEVSKLRTLISEYCKRQELVCVVSATNAQILEHMFIDMIGSVSLPIDMTGTRDKKLGDRGNFLVAGELHRETLDHARDVVGSSHSTRLRYMGNYLNLPAYIHVNTKSGDFGKSDIDKRLTLYVRGSEIVLDGGQQICSYTKRVLTTYQLKMGVV